jgi:hypothetical protein
MWLISPSIGFVSVVQKPWDREAGTLTIRARVGADLDILRAKYLPELGPTADDPKADYRYRATVSREALQRAVAAIAGDIQYSNMKEEVGRVQGMEREVVYAGVWHQLRRLQQRIPVIFAGISRQQDVLDDADDGNHL